LGGELNNSLCRPLISSTSLFTVLSLHGQSDQTKEIFLSPGDQIQAAVDRAPEDSVFHLRAGVYRRQNIQPKSGDQFVGDIGSVLNGSEPLEFTKAKSERSLWTAQIAPTGRTHGSCELDRPLRAYSQDLFFDNLPLKPVASVAELAKDSWFFDQTRNEIDIARDPSGHLLELSVESSAFSGKADRVRISGLIVEKYASAAQYGAVGGNRAGTNWTVNQVEARWNHGAVIALGSGSTTSDSKIHHYGQEGLALSGTDCKVEGNEIAWNNYAGFAIKWDAGGAKFTRTTHLRVENNYVHDNMGKGLWTDIDNVDVVYTHNKVENNQGPGIQHEISYKAVIADNQIGGNGIQTTRWLWNAQIEIQNSSDVEVYGNTITVPPSGGDGIVIIRQARGGGAYGIYTASNNRIHDNSITYLGSDGLSGIDDDTGDHSDKGNSFYKNHYHCSETGLRRWYWFGPKSWRDFQTALQGKDGEVSK
jgi:hypothetical protein